VSRPDRHQTILPGSTIGILGGGQLGRMIALSARHMGYRIVTLDPTQDSPCGQVADRQIVAAFDDAEAAAELASASDVVTYEFENIDAAVAESISRRSYFPQGVAVLATTQHRAREKEAVEATGVPVAPWARVISLEDLRSAVSRLGAPCVLKTATGGYDGKGQRVIGEVAGESLEDGIERAYAVLRGSAREMVVEAFIDYELEISVIVARSTTGELRAFPATENIHVDNILRLSVAPARISARIAAEAERIAIRLAESLDVVGLLAVEMFVAPGGRLLVNELAPRPHNSGHWTMEACVTSQFEQHVRAACGLPLGRTGILTPVVMANVLGEHVEPVLQWCASPVEPSAPTDGVDAKLHLYGKHEARRGRKMGHVNVLASDVDAALAWVKRSPLWG
jgi:5-(carboxyamino)imidazole ribonucleotide synthase